MAYDSTLVVYTSVPLPYISVTPGMNLQTILQNINTAVNIMNPAPDYSGYYLGPYNGYSITQTDGVSHPTDTQNFAEGISKIVCNFEYDYYTFVGTTYPADQSVFSTAITNLQVPGLTYSYTGGGGSITITSGMTMNQLLTATYTGVGNILALLNVPGTLWSALSLANPSNINDAFNSLITYILGIDTILTGKQDTIANFNNSGNCLAGIGGTSSDDITTTVNLLTTYTCSLPVFDAGAITSTCFSTQTSLQDWIQSILKVGDYLAATIISGTDASIMMTPIGPCSGQTIAVDPTWPGLFNTVVDSGDTTPAFLKFKLAAGVGISIDLQNAGSNEQLLITNTLPGDGKVMVNSSDATPNYLQSVLPSTMGEWGIGITAFPSVDNTQLTLTPNVNNPTVLIQNIIDYISTDPGLLAAFCALQTQCVGCICDAPTNFTVAINNDTDIYTLNWVVGANNVTQTVAYRQRGSADWISNVNITDANPQTAITTSATVSNLNYNTVYQFQVTSNCSGTANNGSVYESIIYKCQELTDGVNAGVISVNQAPMLTVDIIEYTLLDSGLSSLQTVKATGSNPIAVFTAVGSGNYTVQWRYGTLINGATLYSTDASQINDYCVSGTIVVPS